MPAMTPARWLDKVRKLCMALAGTTETNSWGHPNWRVGCLYAAVEQYQGRPSLCVLGTLEEQSVLVQDPRLFVPPYVGGKGWVGVWLDTDPPWSLVESLLRTAHRLSAAKTAGKPPARTRKAPAAKRTAKAKSR